MSENLLECIRKIKQKYNKYGQFKAIVDQEATTSQQMGQKIRAMTVAFQVIADQNTQVMRMHTGLIPVLQEKDKQIQLKQLEVKKYRGQMLDLMAKNEQLTNYCRKLANQYTILLNATKDNEETALKRQESTCTKLKMMQNQVLFLRQNVLSKNGIENADPKTIKKQKSLKHYASGEKKEKKQKKPLAIGKSRKSLVHKLF